MKVMKLLAAAAVAGMMCGTPALAQMGKDSMSSGDMKMSKADMAKMKSCNKMSHAMMMKDKKCAMMMKAHPDMMKNDGMGKGH